MSAARAYGKINLALVVGPVRDDGKHEVVTVLHRVGVADEVEVERSDGDGVDVKGFDDTLVGAALSAFAAASGESGWRASIRKTIPVAAGLGGGSSDAATALRLANELVGGKLGPEQLHGVAAAVGADVPFFLRPGAQLGTGDGSELEPLALDLDAAVVLVLPHGAAKSSTADVYRAFDDRGGAEGFADRRRSLLEALGAGSTEAALAALPGNDLAASPVADQLIALGATRAAVSGAGPAVFGLFADEHAAVSAAAALEARGRTWLTTTVSGP